ncbi:MAG: DUF87 domain-containing protein, partial [Dietzia sp.]|nr:DUF87 domain-containing protein [Dietzia sp.]
MTGLVIGSGVDVPGEPVTLDARRFNRHTFWCGQSGSGKTYALGVVLEQLLLHTELPMVILDPNADFVRLPEAREDTSAAEAARLAELDIRVLRSSGDSPGDSSGSSGDGSGKSPAGRLRARYVDLTPASKAALLQLDPIADAEEYNVLLRAEVRAENFDSAGALAAFRPGGGPAVLPDGEPP